MTAVTRLRAMPSPILGRGDRGTGGLRNMLALWSALERRSFRHFSMYLTVLALCGITAVFAGFAARGRHLLHVQMLTRARAEFAGVMLVRRWNAEHGGVWVEKHPGDGSPSSPTVPSLETADGKTLLYRSHAVMTREIGDLSRRNGATVIHLTSLRPLNPANRPDATEREALQAFERGKKEHHWIEKHAGQATFHYMGRLIVDESCLPCHAAQGYRVGEVRGGLTVAFNIESVARRISTDVAVTAAAGLLVFLALIGPVGLLVRRLRIQLRDLRRQLEAAATTDVLTGLANRRFLMDRFHEELDRHRRFERSLGCILLDLDHFKEINDRFGHLAGDQVLRLTAEAARRAVRPYDILGRWGGEELMVLLPEADIALTSQVADRLRELVALDVRAGSGERDGQPVTVSLGMTCSRDGDEVDTIIARADRALYRAKQAGRNRVETES
ncbi:MAG: diguanylate cyclase [Thermoanaerobaculaceae bacterium]|nr:diguanylate cyclase [Thermoanaerobaculaceae bacterium]